MYVPAAFAVEDQGQIAALLERDPLACLITHGPTGLVATHLPLICDLERGALSGHLARANPHAGLAGDGQALAVFSGPNAYVSPNWYPGKAEHGRVVPTWNYEAVHIHGQLTWHEDAEWLRSNVAALTDRFEADQPKPWSIDDAPEAFTDQLLGAIIGVELRIERIEAKRKLSQNRSAADQAGVAAGLMQTGKAGDRQVAQLMDTNGAL